MSQTANDTHITSPQSHNQATSQSIGHQVCFSNISYSVIPHLSFHEEPKIITTSFQNEVLISRASQRPKTRSLRVSITMLLCVHVLRFSCYALGRPNRCVVRPFIQLVRSHQIGPIYKARAARAKAATEPRVAPILPAAPVKVGGSTGAVVFPVGFGASGALVDDESQTVT